MNRSVGEKMLHEKWYEIFNWKTVSYIFYVRVYKIRSILWMAILLRFYCFLSTVKECPKCKNKKRDVWIVIIFHVASYQKFPLHNKITFKFIEININMCQIRSPPFLHFILHLICIWHHAYYIKNHFITSI